MFNNSLAAMKRIAKLARIAILIFSVVSSLLFIGFYTYLLVIHIETIVLLVAYSILILVELVGIMNDLSARIFVFYNNKKKMNYKFALKIFSWLSRSVVIGYNIYYMLYNPVTDLNKTFLIASSILLLADIIISIIGRFLTHSYEAFIYSLLKDYRELYLNKDEDPDSLPFGIELTKLNNGNDYESFSSKAYVEYMLTQGIKIYFYNHNDEYISPLDLDKLSIRLNREYRKYARKYNREDVLKIVDQLNIDKDDEKIILFGFILLNNYFERYTKIKEEIFYIAYLALNLYLRDGMNQITEMLYNSVIEDMIMMSETLKEEIKDDKYIDLLSRYAKRVLPHLLNLEKEKKNSYTISNELKDIAMQEAKRSAKNIIKEEAKKPFKKIGHLFRRK